ncbi:MAG: signal recognition particle-docking protein FtsY [Treponema sp.]|nr:signal recognition particle-docking protein FtsY [Treponema sp.]
MAKLSFAQKLKSLFGLYKSETDEFFDDLTDALVEGDMGAKTAFEVVSSLEKSCREEKLCGSEEVTARLEQMLISFVKKSEPQVQKNKVNVFLLLGVNGVGKTTSCAKLAKRFKTQGENVILAASDTFRAAAVDQISLHAEKLGVRIVKHQMGSDPGAVVFDACEACRASGGGLVIADTAGRLHNKENLVNELKKIERIASSKADEGCLKKILVIDATTGQNAVRQAEVFNEAVGLDSVILTKYDSTAKGGEIITIGKELSLPVSYVCTGEGYDDIKVFDPEDYIKEFIGTK